MGGDSLDAWFLRATTANVRCWQIITIPPTSIGQCASLVQPRDYFGVSFNSLLVSGERYDIDGVPLSVNT